MYVDVPDSNPKTRMRLQIDENLKRIYGDTLSEPVPDRLTLLMNELRRQSILAESNDGTDTP